MANENVTAEDLKATAKAQAKVAKEALAAKAAAAADTVNDQIDNAQTVASDTIEGTVERVQNFSLNQKLLLVSGATLLGTVIVQKIFEHFRKPDVFIEEQIVNIVPTI